MKKPFYLSKGKVGAVLVAAAAIIGAVGGFLEGSIDANGLLQALMVFGGGLGIWGVRDKLG